MNPSETLFLTENLATRETLKIAENMASSRSTILITGESGTGKEVLAKFIHNKSHRAQHRMIAVNCAAVPETLLESELFGFEKGAFTGAQQTKPGKFELAHQSTFLLDEVTEMPLTLQAKLLRVIQEGEVERLGGRHPIKVNVRIIAATNRDLAKEVKEGRFREDLYYRLNVLPIHLLPLRMRTEDILLLARKFTEESCISNSKSLLTMTPAAERRLLNYRWPGNVRELENVIERSVLTCTGSKLDVADILIQNEIGASAPEDFTVGTTLSELERRMILKTLTYTQNNRTHAAKILGISIRTLRNKLHDYRIDGIEVPQPNSRQEHE